MRRPEPYYKKSHRAWYYNANGRPVRLASEEEGEQAAWTKYDCGGPGLADSWRDVFYAATAGAFSAS